MKRNTGSSDTRVTCANFMEIATVGADGTGYTNSKLTANGTYRYRVLAYNTGGSSRYSDIAAAMTLKR